MSYIRKVKNGYRAEVEKNGVRKSITMPTRGQVAAWALAEEAEILAIKRGGVPAKSFREALERYRDNHSINKGGAAWEIKRVNAILRDFPKLVEKPLREVNTGDFAEWRDARLAVVSKGTVQRDVNLLSNVFTLARTEWRWRTGDSPFVGFRRPGNNPARTRIVGWREIRVLVRWLGHKSGRVPETKQQQVALAYLIAHRTAMRAGEVLQLCPAIVDEAGRKATIAKHKTLHISHEARVVPLSKRALRLIALIPDGGFTLTSASLDALFRKAKKASLTEGSTFHDSRASALTRFAAKVDVMTLARISGHRDLGQLLRSYFRPATVDIAARLD